MSRFTTVHNASGAVASGADFDFDFTVGLNICNVGKIKVVPSAAVKGYKLEIYKKATRLLADLMYRTKDPKTGSTFDPSDRNGNEVLQGWVLPYEDLDGTNKIHCRLHNYDAVARSYDTYIDYENPAAIIAGAGGAVWAEPVAFVAAAGSLANPATAVINIRLYRNGVRLKQVTHYTVAGNKQDLTLIVPTDGTEYFEAEYF